MWQRFRAWRRSRPFWGGVLTVLAGLEIIGSMNLELHGGTISIGQEGFTAYLIAFVLMITGPLAWFTPAQRHFYGLVAVFVAIYSLLGVNLGGFFVGMLLGVAGGGLIFAWSPGEAFVEPAQDDVTAVGHEDASPPSGDDTTTTAAVEDVESGPKARSPRHAAMIIIAVAVSLSAVTAIVTPGRAGAAGAPCSPTGTSTSAPSDTRTPTPGSILGGILDFFDRLFGGGTPGSTSPSPEASPSAPASPSPSPCPSGEPSTSPTPQPTPTGVEPTASSSPGTPVKPSPSRPPTASPSPSPSPSPAKVLATVAGQPNVARRPSRMTGSRVVMHNLVFDGVVELPTVDGTIRVLRFSMSQSDTSDFLLHVYGKDGWDIDLHSSRLTVKVGQDGRGPVYFYTNRFQANLLGVIPVDYTPDNLPPPIPLPFVFFTNPNVQLVWVQSPVLEAPDLRTTLVRS